MRPDRAVGGGTGDRASDSLRACVLALLLLALPGSIRGQGSWTELSTVGYAGLGVGAGLLLSRPHLSAYDPKVLVGALAGAIVGHQLGSRAETAVDDGLPLGTGRLWAVRVGTVSGVAAVAAAAAGLYVGSTGGNDPGEDERILAAASALGAVLGALYQWRIETRLADTSRSLVDLSILPAPDGRVSVEASLTLGGGFERP